MIHRALMGSLERFFGILIENYGGDFPLWLAPVQTKVLTIAERHDDYAKGICRQFKTAEIRAETDVRNEKIGYKIREASLRKIPYLVIIGDKEVAEQQITVRKRNGENIGPFSIVEFIEIMQQAIRTKQ